MKRDRLEEAKAPEEATGTEEGQARCQPTSPSSTSIVASASSKNVLCREFVWRQNATMYSMPLPPSSANVSEAQLISAFWECYIPSWSRAQTGSACAWLQHSICLPNPPPALRLALKAVAMTRLGWLHKDDAFVRGGRAIYGNALIELQKALYDKRSMWQDETMATCNVLALYEVNNFLLLFHTVLIRSMQLSESTTASMIGYSSHVEGLTNLIIMRGSDRYRSCSPLARAMFEETRLKTVSHDRQPSFRLAARLIDHSRCSSLSSIAKHRR